ncbi:hypothetical protein JCM21900_004579 [Sporobolomyces salmonicolor]
MLAASPVAVQLHPTAQRHPAPVAPSDSLNSPPSPLATTPFFPQIDAIFPEHSQSSSQVSTPRRVSSNQATPSSSTPSSLRSVASHGGLQVDPLAYPLYSLAPNAPEIRVLTAEQYAELHERDARAKLVEKELFPWSHGGADLPYTPATQYFGFSKGKAAAAPNYRGLTTVKAPSPPAPSPSSRNLLRRKLTSFSSWSASSSDTLSSSSSFHSPSPSPPPSSTPTCRLVSSFDATKILSTHPSSGQTTFALPAASHFQTVNLRHFALQAAKYATVSDIVVYGEDGIDENVVETAAKVKEAMEHEWKRRGGQGVRYHVFMVAEPFSVFERDHPALVAVDSHGFSRNRLDFFEREKEEMRVLTQASEIGENVWLGNSQDVPMASTRVRPVSSDSASSLLDDGNPHSFAICVESHDGAPLMSATTLAHVDQELHTLETQGQPFEEVRRLLHGEEIIEAKSTVLRPQVDDIIHLESLSTPTALGSSSRAQTAFVNQLVDLALWLRDEAAPPLRSNRLPRRVLIHCADGYTETSLLALAYVMLTRRIPAPEAYLFLQLECERSFFVYPTDKDTVLKLERRIKDVLDREDEEEDATLRWEAKQLESTGMERSDSGFVDSTEDPLALVAESKSDLPIPVGERQEMRLASVEMDAWFFGPTFEGHFPSRILPFLYLGNLNHASNALMLKQLGITHVVSLGESALTPPRAPPFSFSSAFRSNPEPAPNSLWLEERLGNISVLDMKNVADDGIDSIQPCIDEALAFIEQARRQGGKILVHCKVGVSRSASIVIAYLMKEVGLDLASAYLLTRSRRLNILIQPNLPFMATLHAFEASLLEEKDQRIALRRSSPAPSQSDSASLSSFETEDDDDNLQYLGLAGLKRSNRLGWSFICGEIAKLNERFLC